MTVLSVLAGSVYMVLYFGLLIWFANWTAGQLFGKDE